MQLWEIVTLLDAKVLTGGSELSREVKHAFASDLMSDVLTVDHRNTLLITGLSNLQSIRTAEMSDIGQVIVVRNKEVSVEMIRLASASNIVLLTSSYSMYRVSGILYQAGIEPIF